MNAASQAVSVLYQFLTIGLEVTHKPLGQLLRNK